MLANVTPGDIGVYLFIAVMVALEGEAAILLAATAAAAGFLDPWAVFGVAAGGNLLSDGFWYALGYYSPIDSLLRRLHRFGLTAARLDSLKQHIDRDVTRLLLVAKLTNWVTIPALVAIGVARVHWKRWFLLVFASNVVIAAMLVPLGYYMASAFLQIQRGWAYLSLGLTLLLVLAAIFYGQRRLRQQRLSLDLSVTDAPDGEG